MAFPKLGQEVILTCTITSVFCTENTEPNRQAFNVRLKDGQCVHTNIGNLYLYEEPEAEEPSVDEEDTVTDEPTETVPSDTDISEAEPGTVSTDGHTEGGDGEAAHAVDLDPTGTPDSGSAGDHEGASVPGTDTSISEPTPDDKAPDATS